MKKVVGVLLLVFVLMGINFADISAKEVTMEGTDVDERDVDENSTKVKGVLLYELKDAEMTKLILGNQVQVVYYNDHYETYPRIPQHFESNIAGCPKLEAIEIQKENKYYKTQDGVLYSKDGELLVAVPMNKSGKLVIPEGTKQIGRCAINGCSKLTSITIPSTLKNVCDAGLGGNKGVTKYTLSGSSKYFAVKDGVLFTKDMKTLVSYPSGKKNQTYQVPKGVKTISPGAFMENSYLQEVKLADSVKLIDNEAFKNCTALRKFVSGKKLRHIYAGAFGKCKKLKNVIIKEGLLTIEDECFVGTTSLKKIYLPQTLYDVSGVVNSKKKIEVTAYYHSQAWSYFLHEKNVKLITKKHKKTKQKLVRVKDASIGTGKASIKWYKKGRKKYSIKSPDDLAGLAKLVNKGNDFAGCTIEVTKNLNLVKYKNFPQIGGYHKVKGKDKECVFRGGFNGKNHIVANLSMNNGGLFYQISLKAYIKNVCVKGADIDGCSNTGALVGDSDGVIEHCRVYGRIKGTNNVGAIAGMCENIKDCSSHATVCGTEYVGGVAGRCTGVITKCRNHGTVTGVKTVGGIIGKGYDMITCQNYGKVCGYEDVSGLRGDGFNFVNKDCNTRGEVVHR